MKVKNSFVKCHVNISECNLTTNDMAITACRLAAGKIVNEILAQRKKEVSTFLHTLRLVDSLEIDYDERQHNACSEPYIYDTAYEKVDRSNIALPMHENGWCVKYVGTKYHKKQDGQCCVIVATNVSHFLRLINV